MSTPAGAPGRSGAGHPLGGWLLVGAAGAAFALAVAFLPPGGADTSICLLRRGFGLPCPGCGLTRATGALLRGDFAASWAWHPLAGLLVAQAALLWAADGLRRLGRPAPGRLPALGPLVAANGALLVALWLGRVATGSLPW